MTDDLSEEKQKLWLFVNHFGEFRYIYSDVAPKKMFVYGAKVHHTVKRESYHGSYTPPPENFCCYSDEKIFYYGILEKCTYNGNYTSDMSYFEPEIIGTLLPRCFVPDRFKNLSFDDSPVMISEDE